jgi:hypothetical protein
LIEWIGGGDGEAGEGVVDPGPGVEAELLAGEGEAGEGGESLAAVVGAEEEPVLAADGEGLDGPLGAVVVDGEVAVGRVDREGGPLDDGAILPLLTQLGALARMCP